RAGAYMEDLDDWYLRAEGDTITLQGKLSPTGLRQILSINQMPAPNVPAASGSEAPGDPKIAASQRFFKAVVKTLADLGKQKPKSFSNLAFWIEKTARTIDQLPLLDV